MDRYNLFDVSAPDYVPMAYSSSDDESDPAAYLAGLKGTYVADDQTQDLAETIESVTSNGSEVINAVTGRDTDLDNGFDDSPDSEIAQ
jgi:hypothetical protein